MAIFFTKSFFSNLLACSKSPDYQKKYISLFPFEIDRGQVLQFCLFVLQNHDSSRPGREDPNGFYDFSSIKRNTTSDLSKEDAPSSCFIMILPIVGLYLRVVNLADVWS